MDSFFLHFHQDHEIIIHNSSTALRLFRRALLITSIMCNSKQSKSVPVSSLLQNSRIVLCKTVFEKPTQQMNIGDLKTSDVEALKAKDPFMYYSIPGTVRSAELRTEFDASSFGVRTNTSGTTSKKQKRENKDCIITRKTRVSFEYADLLLENLIEDVEFAQSEVDDVQDSFLDMLARRQE